MALLWNRYGKAHMRLVKVRRTERSHDLVDLTLDVRLEGEFEPVYVDGDNSLCLATDTMKNTVYAFARHDPIDYVEAFSERLSAHFAAQPAVTSVRIAATEHRWARLDVNGRPDPHAFVQNGAEQWTSLVVRDQSGVQVTAGLKDLVVLKTTDSGFSGFPRDRFTTLAEASDRILATSVSSTWRYRPGTIDYSARDRVRTALVETFAAHKSLSVQHTLYAMGEAALAASPEILDITMSLPNRHHLLVDLKPFGLDNPNEIFVATDQPYGLIEATVGRDGSSKS